jgi:UDP-N-acetylmuramate dehydrogenase
MLPHCTFRAGGSAEYFVTAEDESVLKELLEFLSDKGVDHFVLGNGSNVLVSDSGYKGVIIKPGRGFEKIEILDERLKAGSAVSLIKLSMTAAEASLTGLEFASGIPGSIGGAVYMNAGAYGGEMKDVVVSVRLMKPDGSEIYEADAAELEFGYRHSKVEETGDIALSAVLCLKHDDPDEIAARVRELQEKRNSKQPVNFPSAGSTFKRPVGGFAAALIDQAGLKGYRVGGAMVSEKHAGFVINAGGATAEDVLSVMRHVRKTVYENSGIMLEPEVRLINCSL